MFAVFPWDVALPKMTVFLKCFQHLSANALGQQLRPYKQDPQGSEAAVPKDRCLVVELESPHCLSLSRFDIYYDMDILCVHSYAKDIRTMLASAHFCPDLPVFLSFGQLGNSSFHS